MARPHRIDLPGLIGSEPLGFLAAVGLLDELLGSCYLSWDPKDQHAILHSGEAGYSSISDVVGKLLRRLDDVKPGWAIPNSTGFPLRRRRGGPDPLRMRPEELRRRERDGKGDAHWLRNTLTGYPVDADGYCTVNPLIAVRGRQTIGSFWYYPMLEVKKDPQRLLTEALAGWRRVEGADGWLLDHRATYSADPGLGGPGGSMAVPGATWLATLTVTRFGYYSRSGVPRARNEAAGWFRAEGRDVFLWPLWTLPVSANTLDAIWNVGCDYGEWELTPAGDGTMQARICDTHGVAAPNARYATVDAGIFTMCAAARPSPQGPLTPVPVRTSRKPRPHGESPAWEGWDWQAPEPPKDIASSYR